jgi:hypothetical protein
MPDSPPNNGWRKRRFDEMAVMVNDRIDDPAEAEVGHYVGLEHLDSDSLTIHRWGAPSDVEATKLRFRAGDIIFGRRRVYQRKLAVAHFDGICSAHAMVLRAKPDVVLPEFLPFFMQSDLFMERAKEISVGSLSPTINWKTLAEEEFALPSLEEQRRIAALLAQFQALDDRLFKLKMTADDLLEAEREHAFTDSRLIRKPLSAIASVRYGLGQPPQEVPEGVAMIRATNIDRGRIVAKDLMRIDPNAIPDSRRVFLEEGEILLVRSGAYTGDSALITKEWAGSVAGYDLVICPDSDRINPQYLAHFLLARRTVVSVLRALSARTAQPHLNADDMAGISVPRPDMSLQTEAVERMTRIQQCIESLLLRLDNLKRLKSSVVTAMWSQ